MSLVLSFPRQVGSQVSSHLGRAVIPLCFLHDQGILSHPVTQRIIFSISFSPLLLMVLRSREFDTFVLLKAFIKHNLGNFPGVKPSL